MNTLDSWASPPAVPVATGSVRSALLRTLAEVAAIVAAVVAAAWLLSPGITLAASSVSTLSTWLSDAPASVDGPWAVLLRRLVKAMPAAMRGEPLWALQVLQTALGGLGIYLVGRLAWALARGPGAVAAVALVLVWPAGRAALLHWSAETPLALTALMAALAAVSQVNSPRAAALGLGLAGALTVAVHPLGLLVGPLLLLAAMLLPLEPARAAAGGGLAESLDRPDLPTGPRWLGVLAGVLLAVGLLLALVGPGGLKPWGTAQFAVLRRPEAVTELGGAAGWPVVGPWMALLGQTPFAVSWLALGPLLRGLGRTGRATPLAGAAAVAAVWLITLAIASSPLSLSLDALLVLAPLACALAGVGFAWRWAGLLQMDRRVGLAVWLIAAIALLAADLWVSADDRRSLPGRIPGVMGPSEPLQGAQLGPADLALLQRFPEPTAILPARRGGMELANAVKPLSKSLEHGVYVPAHLAQLVLLPESPVHPVDQVFADHATRLGCTADTRPQLRHCLVRLVGRAAPSKIQKP